MSKQTYKTIDLFAGVGGIRIGFERAGFKTVFANDFDPACKFTHDLNHKETKLTIKDIREINSKELPAFDLLLGGFPASHFLLQAIGKDLRTKKIEEIYFLKSRIC